ncbi:MAG: energy transducer TonB [Bacteroidales bacterium]|nr:energy transducer TonB [Bacteroidales bacterium]
MKVTRIFLSAILMLTLCFGSMVCHAQKCHPATYKDGELAIEKYESGDSIEKITIRPPKFESGLEDLYQYIADSLQYPEALKSIQAEGTTIVQFMVNTDGSLSDITIVKKSGYDEMDDEALRIVNSFPEWKAGKKDGEVIPILTQLPIHFTYSE